jgi:hypothetical protein
MKTKVIVILSAVLVSWCNILYSQEFQPPSPGKAVLYFVRATSYGFAVTFQYFDNNKFIGEFKGENYLRYECEPGKHLFWSVSENKEFMEADLAEGGTYIVKVDVITGGWKAHVGFTPISYTDTKRFEACRDLVRKEKPIVPKEEDLAKMNVKLAKKIERTLSDFNSREKDERKVRVLSSDMAIPPEGLK